MTRRPKGLISLLSSYSRTLDLFIAVLCIILGIYIYFVGFEDIHILITIFSLLFVVYGIKKIVEGILRLLMGREMRELTAEEKE